MNIILEIAIVALLALVTARSLGEPWRGRAFNVLKLYLTVRMVWLLLLWPVDDGAGGRTLAWNLILDQLGRIDAGVFWTFAAIGAAVRFLGVLASMYRWQLVLRGQRIELPFWHILGAFLIGRAIGFFLPSTAGLDAYKLYDAARFSGRSVEVTAGTVLEKVLGVTGIFLTYLVALPFGMSIFGDNALLVASITVPLALGIIGALLALLWFPGLVQWVIENLPLPAKAQLSGIVTRTAQATAAYRNEKRLVLMMLLMSFFVHFFTAAMYFFMAIAVGASMELAFWPVVFGSSIQIFATVIGPTIGGIGIREAAQVLTLGSLLGLSVAAVSATLGFWVGEVPTLFGFLFWFARGKDYRPAYCRVDGEQVDYEEAAAAAAKLQTDAERAALGTPPPLAQRLATSSQLGFGAGVLAGLLVGIAETLLIASGGLGGDAQVLWYGPLAYALCLGGLGVLGGAVLGLLPMDLDEIRGWTPSLALIGTLIPMGLFIAVFRLRRDVYLEQMPPMPVLLGVLAGFGIFALLLFFVGPRLFRGFAGRLVRPGFALALLAAIALTGALAAQIVAPGGAGRDVPTTIPAELRARPNVILIMVDTLRADYLSCYGGQTPTPHLCGLAEGTGWRLDGFAHASWTKPATATLLTSLLPSSHGAMSKPSRLGDDVEFVSEVLQERGYATGGIVSNINLAESFGFDQGYDEYHYLGPDYLWGAEESSSKLILYQLSRTIFFKFVPGLRPSDFYQPAEVVNEVALDFLARHRDARFFLFLHYMDPHDPYFEHPFDGTGIARAANQHPDPERAEEMRRLYGEEIAYLDAQVGVLLEALREQGLYDDSLIAVVSDHGEEFQEHGGWWHGTTLYDEQIRVPFLLKWPRSESPAGSPEPAYARILDVAPTLIARTGAIVPAGMQGIDLLEKLGARSEVERMVFAEEDHEGNVMRALRTENWKLIEAEPDGPRGLPELELFHVASDPGETRNEHQESAWVIDELRTHADAQEQLARSEAVEGGGAVELSDTERQTLCALGYLECDEE